MQGPLGWWLCWCTEASHGNMQHTEPLKSVQQTHHRGSCGEVSALKADKLIQMVQVCHAKHDGGQQHSLSKADALQAGRRACHTPLCCRWTSLCNQLHSLPAGTAWTGQRAMHTDAARCQP